MPSKRIGVLTGGGDCPGLNAVLRALVRRCLPKGYQIIGLMDGWSGLLEKRFIELDYPQVSGIVHVGGTIIGTSRTNVLKDEETVALAFKNFKELDLAGLVAVGGEGTLTVSSKMYEKGMPIVGVPKTIDNDINAVDFTFGFDTAVEVATQAIDRLHTTAESHKRVMIVEVMGRHAGWIATYSGLAGGADVIVIPEHPLSLKEICSMIEERRKRGKLFSIVVVAEGAKILKDGNEVAVHKTRTDDFGRHQLGGIGQVLANEIEAATGMESRVTVLGHVQRGGTPTAHDRVLATRYGAFAADLVMQAKWGMMASIQGNQLIAVPLSEATDKLKTVSDDLWSLAYDFSG